MYNIYDIDISSSDHESLASWIDRYYFNCGGDVGARIQIIDCFFASFAIAERARVRGRKI